MKDIFDTSYVERIGTVPISDQGPEIDKFREHPIEMVDIRKYGSSKPRREIITAKITQNDES